MIKLVEVTVRFDDGSEVVTALDRVSLTVTPGEFVVLHGPSGSGKSTLLGVAAGLQRFDEGEAHIDDLNIGRLSETAVAAVRLEHIGVVFQDNNLVSELTASENVQLPLSAKGVRRSDRERQAEIALETVGLTGLGTRRPSKLSGGQKQRVGIARAIAGGRRYLLADEPTGSLDSKTSIQIFTVLRSLADAGVGVVIASHDPRVIPWADRDVELVDGKTHEAHRASATALMRGSSHAP